MALTSINSEDRLVQQTFATHLERVLGWDSVYAFNTETFGPTGTLGRASERDVVLVRDLRAALGRLNRDVPESAREQALETLTRVDFARSLVQHNRDHYDFIRNGVPVEWRNDAGEVQWARLNIIDFRAPNNNRFLALCDIFPEISLFKLLDLSIFLFRDFFHIGFALQIFHFRSIQASRWAIRQTSSFRSKKPWSPRIKGISGRSVKRARTWNEDEVV